MRIYSRTGDQGETSLRGGSRVPKDDSRICACGEIDELNSQIGFLRVAIEDPSIDSMLGSIQSQLFEAGAELAGESGEGEERIRDEDVLSLEAAIDSLDATLPPLQRFVLPGGIEAACRAQIARSVCRRAERSVVGLLRSEPRETRILRYLNRLSDLLFVLSRWANLGAGVPDRVWTGRRSREAEGERGEPGSGS